MTQAAQIREFIVANFYVADVESLSETDSFLERGIIDSTGVLEVVAFLERDFGLTVEDADIVPENFDSIANLVGYIGRKDAAL
jgi:acyl carrier protein